MQPRQICNSQSSCFSFLHVYTIIHWSFILLVVWISLMFNIKILSRDEGNSHMTKHFKYNVNKKKSFNSDDHLPWSSFYYFSWGDMLKQILKCWSSVGGGRVVDTTWWVWSHYINTKCLEIKGRHNFIWYICFNKSDFITPLT